MFTKSMPPTRRVHENDVTGVTAPRVQVHVQHKCVSREFKAAPEAV